MKAQTFGITGPQSLLKAIWEEMKLLGYRSNSPFTHWNLLSHNSPSNDDKDLFIAFYDYFLPDKLDKTFVLPKEYNEALAHAKEMLNDKYWVKEPKYVECIYSTSESITVGKIYTYPKIIDNNGMQRSHPLDGSIFKYKPSTKEAYDAQNKPKFVVGKWYKTSVFKGKPLAKDVFFGKYLNSDRGEFVANEMKISGYTSSSGGYRFENGYDWEEATNEEIQAFLPDGHPEKISILSIFKPGDWIYFTWKTTGDVDIFQIKSVSSSGFTSLVHYRNGKALNCNGANLVIDLDRQTSMRLATKEEVDSVTKVKIEPVIESKFKTGDYLTSNLVPKHICKIIKIEGDVYTGWGFDGSGKYYEDDSFGFHSTRDRLATISEIKSFLIKVAELKGFKEGVQHTQYDGTLKFIGRGDFEYGWGGNDNLYFKKSLDLIYKDGQWATIIPSEPEFVLPKVWFIQLTHDNISYVKSWHRSIDRSFSRNYTVGSLYGVQSDGSGDAWTDGYEPEGTIVITDEQFIQYVLKEKTPEKPIMCTFGNLEFTIYKKPTEMYAECKEGRITYQEILNVVNWFDRDISLLGHKMTIKTDGKFFIKFGCCEGSLQQAKTLLASFK